MLDSEIEGEVDICIASGETVDTTYENRTFYGCVELFIINESIRYIDVPERPAFSDARISQYESHGWWTMISWFPLGFALVATKRYYKTPWFFMHHLHGFLGIFVVLATLLASLQAYAYVDWK